MKCPAPGCKVEIDEKDARAQVAHMNFMIAKGDFAHKELIRQRTERL